VVRMLELEVKVVGEKVKFKTHEALHFDEIVAKWLIERFGDKEFLDRYAPNRILEVGVGGGSFDEHPVINGKRKEGECSATLIAKALRIEEDPSLQKLLRFTLSTDLKGGSQPFDLSYLVKVLHQQFPKDPEKVIEWVTIGIEAKYHEQLQFFKDTKEEFDRAAEIEEVQGPGGRMLKMVSIVSDNGQISKFARSVYGGRAAIVIQKRSSGNIQIFTNKKFGLGLFDVARMIRIEEQQAKRKLITTDWKVLESEGKVEGVEEWFYHLEGQMLLNGSLTAPDVPPTKLSLGKIKRIVQIGVNPQAFEPSRAQLCRAGNCSSTKKSKCSWYKWGLQRCRKIRYKMRNPESGK